MGAGYYEPIVQWSKGDYANSSQTQDDLAIIGNNANGVGFRADDHGNTRSAASTISISGSGSTFIAGNIETTSDADFFTFYYNRWYGFVEHQSGGKTSQSGCAGYFVR